MGEDDEEELEEMWGTVTEIKPYGFRLQLDEADGTLVPSFWLKLWGTMWGTSKWYARALRGESRVKGELLRAGGAHGRARGCEAEGKWMRRRRTGRERAVR